MPFILLIEDDRDIREALSELLALEGHQIKTASNGKEAFELLESGQVPSLILCDVTMPVMGGLEFRRRQLQNPEWAKVPTIFLTAAYEAKKLTAHAQVDAVLHKPIQVSELLDLISRIKLRFS